MVLDMNLIVVRNVEAVVTLIDDEMVILNMAVNNCLALDDNRLAGDGLVRVSAE